MTRLMIHVGGRNIVDRVYYIYRCQYCWSDLYVEFFGSQEHEREDAIKRTYSCPHCSI